MWEGKKNLWKKKTLPILVQMHITGLVKELFSRLTSYYQNKQPEEVILVNYPLTHYDISFNKVRNYVSAFVRFTIIEFLEISLIINMHKILSSLFLRNEIRVSRCGKINMYKSLAKKYQAATARPTESSE